MTSGNPRHQPVIEWLRNEGHSDDEIVKILAKLDQYDEETIQESIFDSIDAGTFDLRAIIKEALGEGG